MPTRYKGRIVEIEKNIHRTTHCLTGIPESDQHFYKGRCPGGEGTFVIGSSYDGTTIDMKVFVFDYEKSFTWDLRDFILYKNDAKRISKKLLKHIIESNVGKKVTITVSDDQKTISIDFNQLDVVRPKKER